jgi:DNA-binding winged helix-turn-helix (wHTH) protein/Tol biopolymer transport system component
METREIPTGRVRFGTFDADIHSGELWRNGLKVRIQELPFQVLASLLERAGEVITREELQKRLWPADTFVDFEQGLNKAINKLRHALGDDANKPRFVETLPRRGYRFIAPVDRRRLGQAAGARHVETSIALPQGVPRRERWPLALTALVALIAVGGLVWFGTRRPPTLRPEPKPHRLTANPAGNPATDARISPDGSYLAYADLAGIHLQLIDTGETRIIPPPQGVGHDVTGWSPVGWFPDGTKLLAQMTSIGMERSSLWVISVLEGAPRKIREGFLAWSLSPDGSLIALTSTVFASDIWLMGVNGEEPRKIISGGEGESLASVVWSPNSRRIAYERFRSSSGGLRRSIESCDLKGANSAVILSDPNLPAWYTGGVWWLADGRLIYSRSEIAESISITDTNFWEIKVDGGSGQPEGNPRRITSWSESSLAVPSGTADGKRLVFSRLNEQADVYVGDLEKGATRLKAPPRRLTLDERNDWPFAWTPDSRTILFFRIAAATLTSISRP